MRVVHRSREDSLDSLDTSSSDSSPDSLDLTSLLISPDSADMWSHSGADLPKGHDPLYGQQPHGNLLKAEDISNGLTSVSSHDYGVNHDLRSETDSGSETRTVPYAYMPGSFYYPGILDTSHSGLFNGASVYDDTYSVDSCSVSHAGSSNGGLFAYSQPHSEVASSNAQAFSYAGYDPSVVSADSFNWAMNHLIPVTSAPTPESFAAVPAHWQISNGEVLHPSPYYLQTLNHMSSYPCDQEFQNGSGTNPQMAYGQNSTGDASSHERFESAATIGQEKSQVQPVAVAPAPNSPQGSQGKQDDASKTKKKERPLRKRKQPGEEKEQMSSTSRYETSPTSSQEDDEEFGNTEAEDAFVRKHPIYNVEAGDDGLYHCPYIHEESCGHVPTKLKCTYDKYVDSHLKPHRCKHAECYELKFSSTACRLRHERETHGSHGHGVKPFLCLYAECERSKPGNGFPRSWNRNDHMKRVHEHNTSPGSEDKGPLFTSSSGTAQTSARSSTARKRTATEVGATTNSEKRLKPEGESNGNNGCTGPTRSMRSTKELLFNQWKDQFFRVHHLVHNIRAPSERSAHEQLQKEVINLTTLAERFVQCS